MSRTHGSFGSYARTFRAIIVTALLLACGDSSSTGPGGGGGGGGVAQLSITPSAPTITVGAQLALQAQVRDASGNIISGASVFWSSADTTIVTISSAGIVTGKAAGSAQIAASSGGQSARVVVTVSAAPVATVSVLPAAATLVVGGTTLLKAVTYDANQTELTGRSIVWASSATQVASVDATGNVIGVAAGTAKITATSEGQTGTSTITVTVIPIAAISIAPSSATLTVGQSASLTAIATDANSNVLGGRPITWKSADSTIATVSTHGLATAIAPGSTTISATAEDKSGTATITVSNVPVASITVTPTSASLLVGGTATLTAVTKDAGGNVLAGRTVTWTSSVPSIASVSATGASAIVTGVAAGNATITATSEGQSVGTPVTVALAPVATVTLTPNSASLVVGHTVTIVAVLKDANGTALSGRPIAWSSNTPGVATVDANGVVTAVTAGTATISATSEGKTATAAITVSLIPVAFVISTPTSANLYVGATLAMSAVTTDANNNVLGGRVVTWSTSAPSVAMVDPTSGLVTAVGAGNATITATSEGKTGAASLVVAFGPVATVTVTPLSAGLFIGGPTTRLTAVLKDAYGNVLTGRVITWASSNTAAGTVDASGVVTAAAAGTTSITATSEGKTSNTSIITVSTAPVATVTLSPTSASLIVGGPTTTLTAVLKDAYGNVLTGRAITWTSGTQSVATVSSGVVTAVAAGTTAITATSEGKTSNTSTITVTTAPVATVTLSPTTASLIVGGPNTNLTAVLKDAYGNVLTGRAIVWASSNTAAATVDASGVVTAVAAGTTSITATSETKSNSPATITVTTAPVATVTLSPTSASLIVGGPN